MEADFGQRESWGISGGRGVESWMSREVLLYRIMHRKYVQKW